MNRLPMYTVSKTVNMRVFFLLEISVNCAALLWQIVYLCRDEGILLPRRIPFNLQLSLIAPKSAPLDRSAHTPSIRKLTQVFQPFKSSCKALSVLESLITLVMFSLLSYSLLVFKSISQKLNPHTKLSHLESWTHVICAPLVMCSNSMMVAVAYFVCIVYYVM